MLEKAAASAVVGFSADFYEAALLAERVETSVSNVATVGASQALKELFDLEFCIIRRHTGGKRDPRNRKTVVCCNNNTFLATV